MEFKKHLFDFIVLVLLPAISGSFTSDYVKTLKGEYLKVKLVRVFIGAVFSVIISYSLIFEPLVVADNPNLLMLASFLLSLLGFELAQGFCTLDGLVGIVGKLDLIIQPILGWMRDFNEFRQSKKIDEKDKDIA